MDAIPAMQTAGGKDGTAVELKDLEIFQMVAESGTVSEAARALNYVQSNITMRIRKLERELGVTLFHRHRRGMALTPEGKKMLGYSREMLRLAEEMRKAAGDGEEPSGKLEIGTVETVIRLPELLTAYMKKYPNVDLTLHAGVTEELERRVLDRELDGAFVTETAFHPDLAVHEAFRDELVLIADRDTASLDRLEEKALLCFRKGCGYRVRLEAWYWDRRIEPQKVLEFGTMETILQSVAMGLGVSFVPRDAAARLIDEGKVRFFRLPDRYSKIRTVFIRRADGVLTATMQKLIDMIEENGRRSAGPPDPPREAAG